MAIVATSGAGTKGICTYSFAFILILLRMQITFWWILKELLVLPDNLVVHSLGVCFSEKSRSDWRSDGPSGTFSHLRTGPLELSSKCPLDYPCLDTNHSLSSGVLLDPMTWFLIWYASNIGCNKKKKTRGSQKRNEACQMMTTLLCKLVFQTKYLWNVVKILSLSLSSF